MSLIQNSLFPLWSVHFQSKKCRYKIYRTVHECSVLYKLTICKIIKKSFHSIKKKVRYSTEKKFLLYQWESQKLFCCSQDFELSFTTYTSYEMLAQNPIIFSNFCGHARQRGRVFDNLVQTLRRTAIPLIKKYIVPAAKKMKQMCLKLPFRFV